MPEQTGPVGRITVRPALTVASVLTLLAVFLFVVGLLGVELPVPGTAPAPAAVVAMFAMGLVAAVVVARGVYHLLAGGSAAPPLRYERYLRFAESALGVAVLLGVLAGLGLLVAVLTHVALVIADPDA